MMLQRDDGQATDAHYMMCVAVRPYCEKEGVVTRELTSLMMAFHKIASFFVAVQAA